MEKHEEHSGHTEEKGPDEKVAAYFAKEFDFSFDEVHALLDFFEAMRDFSHHLTENHYYSETLNSKVVNCTLELHALALELKAVELQAGDFSTKASKAILSDRAPAIVKNAFTDFQKRFAETRKRCLAVHASLLSLVEEIKKEYQQKKFTMNGV